jgi:hypothetical protein
MVLWRCLGGCDAYWWAGKPESDDEWYERIQCRCPIGAEPDFEIVDLAQPGPGQRALL